MAARRPARSRLPRRPRQSWVAPRPGRGRGRVRAALRRVRRSTVHAAGPAARRTAPKPRTWHRRSWCAPGGASPGFPWPVQLLSTWLYRIAVNEANPCAGEAGPGGRPGSSIGAGGNWNCPPPGRRSPPGRQRTANCAGHWGRPWAGLPPPLRTAIVSAGRRRALSTQEAAEIAGVGQAAFKSRLHQARLRVRAAIGDEGPWSAPADKPG